MLFVAVAYGYINHVTYITFLVNYEKEKGLVFKFVLFYILFPPQPSYHSEKGMIKFSLEHVPQLIL